MAGARDKRSKGREQLPRGPHAISPDAVAADQRRRLLEALPQAVSESGFKAATVDQIVKLAHVRRNSFYEQFADKRDCFAAAYEIAQERLFGVLTFRCYTHAGLAEGIDAALGAGLGLLAEDPVLTRLVFLEAPAAGGGIATRHDEWLDRYGRMLRFAAIGNVDVAAPKRALEPALVGAMVSRVKQLTLVGKHKRLPNARTELVELALSYYGSPETSGVPAVAESAQPQSPLRRSVLEPA